MSRRHSKTNHHPETGHVPVPEFYMPAMPPVQLTEALDRRVRHWLQRRKFRRLLKYDDKHLAVLGLSREDLVWAARQPMQADAFEVLQQRLRRFARSGQRARVSMDAG